MKTGSMRAAGRTADTRTPPNPRSDARPEPRRRARKATHPVMRGGVVSPCGQPSRESTPPYAAINAASPAAECAHDASVSHRSLIQVFAIPAAYARRGGPHRHPTWTTRTRPTTTNGCSPPTGRRPGPASPSPRSRDGDPNAANRPTSRSADSSDTADPTSTEGSKTTPSTRRNDGNQKKQCTRCVPDGQAPEKQKGGIVEIPPIFGRAGGT